MALFATSQLLLSSYHLITRKYKAARTRIVIPHTHTHLYEICHIYINDKVMKDVYQRL
jgi:hypothetical protein